MATLKQRLHRKNGSAYDVIHMETESNVVLRPSGNTVETDLTNYLPKVQNSDDVPEGLTPGQIVIGTTKTWFCGMDGKIYELTSQGGSWFPQYGKNFTYTGDYIIVPEDENNWKVKFLTSGTFTATDALLIDVFAVGGGGSGSVASTSGGGSAGTGAGGGGGYTTTQKSVYLEKNKSYDIVIGNGGSAVANSGSYQYGYGGKDGGSTSGFNVIANGGKGGLGGTSSVYVGDGGAGGSGGGARANSAGSATAGEGGSDGSNGGNGTAPYGTLYKGGTGQGTTTREFEEPTGDLYAGGGGGSYSNGKTTVAGGAGGGGTGNGAASGTNDGTANTGGGGGGQGYGGTQRNSGAGGSGILIIRNHRE